MAAVRKMPIFLERDPPDRKALRAQMPAEAALQRLGKPGGAWEKQGRNLHRREEEAFLVKETGVYGTGSAGEMDKG